MYSTQPISSYGGRSYPNTITFLDGSMVPYESSMLMGEMNPENTKIFDVTMITEIFKTIPVDRWRDDTIRKGYVNSDGHSYLCNILYMIEELNGISRFRIKTEPPGTRFNDAEMKYIRELDEPNPIEIITRFEMMDFED